MAEKQWEDMTVDQQLEWLRSTIGKQSERIAALEAEVKRLSERAPRA